MIDGVVIAPQKVFPDDRGTVMRMLRETDAHFAGFGEVYFSQVFPGVVKAWHWHERMVINYAVPVGRIKLVLFDDREGSPTKGELQEIYLGTGNYSLVQVPVKVWNGFKGVSPEPALVCNCSTIVHDDGEMKRLDPMDNDLIPYDWALKHR